MTKKLFFIILLLGFLGSILAKDHTFSSLENRTLQVKPTFSIDTLLDRSYLTQMDTYLNDQFIGRTLWVRLKTLSDRVLFAKSEINQVYFGSDGYFINRYLDSDLDAQTVAKNIDYLNCFSARYQADVVLIPTASEIITEKLPSFSSHINQEKLLKDVASLVPVSSILKTHAKEPIYFKTDHHWTLLGAYYAYAALVDSPLPFQSTVVSDSFRGSTFRKINIKTKPDQLERFTSPHRFSVIYDESITTDSLYNDQALQSADQYPYYLDGNHAVTQIINETTDSDQSLLIIKDSFGNNFSTLICNHYKNTHLLDLRYYNGSIADYCKLHKIDDVLFLYNNINFMQDKNLYKLLQ